MNPKLGTNSRILNSFENCQHSNIMHVETNPFYPKNFLTIGDNTAKIWCEDLQESNIFTMKPSSARLTGGCWSPARISVFYTIRVDGVLEVWDFLFEQRLPVLPVKVADFPLYTLKANEKGSLLCVGAGDGSTSILKMDPRLLTANRLERSNTMEMFDRETRRERILVNRKKALKVEESQKKIYAKARHFQKQEEEEKRKRAGCPVKKAEMEYFRILEQVKEERKQFLMENILDKDKIF
ncbi:dynein intermediate chain 2, axonemal [Eurytemora carolleeae]|uniref:dynein intermediate chain 2, axonemal n=1 Tax=Eurytemora carolleeae TaxID=1294199 RepID=UPI000C7685E7|nr:dynein intermediate chain 2, axonemal [Eurytemora carolleeae]|eukprot:XP_023322611.1 dynein intermediate chain 2, axonemal-like [Eurytemora affinis]